DIGNIRVGMPVDIRIDAYPFTEFGSISGVVTKVGSEAIAVDGAGRQTVFPVEVQLKQQFLEQSRKRFSLVPGMSLVANIKVRERAPISYVTEELIKAIDTMQSVR
ncbi:MAG TPA: HlyD family secretion protein, partial [Allocoleopsis sp.]